MIKSNVWAVVPAAGAGRRMGAVRPKQYFPLLGKPVLVHTVERLCNHSRISGVVVCISANDIFWEQVKPSHPSLREAVVGGEQRAESVRNGLRSLDSDADPEDWVMVHDGVRPCLRDDDIKALMEAADDERGEGAVLGIPLIDTIKRTDSTGHVLETVPRELLWRAQTPQMFRLHVLSTALDQAMEAGLKATDESAAMEYAGKRPVMVIGHPDNIKITTRQDLSLAELYLQRQEKEH